VKTLLVLLILVSGASAWGRVANNSFLKGRKYAPLSQKSVLPKVVPKPTPKPIRAAPVVTQKVVTPLTVPVPLPRPKIEQTEAPANIVPNLIAPVPVTMSPSLAMSRAAPATTNDPGPFGTPTPATTKDSEVVTAAPDTTVNTASVPTINDLPNCRYRTDCWKNLSLSQEIKKIVANIRYVNGLHDTKIDPRYMLCTGYRESTFNPGAVSGSNAKGIFQVIPSTGKAALRQGSKLPGFSGKSWNDFSRDMVHSSLAQTEISLLVLRMKVREGASSRILSGSGTIEDYKDLAWRYIGKTNSRYSLTYRSHITSCFTCLRGVSDSNINNGEPSNTIKNCLAKAK
jgi:hypothetical protein